MTTVALKDRGVMEMKRVSISAKRQITIPQKFFSMLGFDTEAECILRGNELVLRPVKKYISSEFAEEILKELITEGYSGTELLEEFKLRQKAVRPAVEAMLTEAEKVASGESAYVSYDEVFGEEETV